jgi:hypothetical protein
VVFPARVGNQHLGGGIELLEEVSADFQATGAANALHGGHTARLDRLRIGAEHQALDRGVVRGDAVNGQIASRGGLFHHGLFGRLHALQERQFSVVIEVHPDTEIDLVGIGIGCKLLVQTQDRIAGGHFDSGEERHGGSLEVGSQANSPGLR